MTEWGWWCPTCGEARIECGARPRFSRCFRCDSAASRRMPPPLQITKRFIEVVSDEKPAETLCVECGQTKADHGETKYGIGYYGHRFRPSGDPAEKGCGQSGQ